MPRPSRLARFPQYYKVMVDGSEDSWNIRDQHMFDTLERLVEHHGACLRGMGWLAWLDPPTHTQRSTGGTTKLGYVRVHYPYG